MQILYGPTFLQVRQEPLRRSNRVTLHQPIKPAFVDYLRASPEFVVERHGSPTASLALAYTFWNIGTDPWVAQSRDYYAKHPTRYGKGA
jgi:hypothetical protein